MQRVAVHLSDALALSGEVCLLDGRGGSLRHIGPAASLRLDRIRKGSSINRSFLGRVEQRIAEALPIGKPWVRRPGDILLDIEPSWHAPASRSRLLPTLQATSTRSAALVPDLLAVSDPQWFPEQSTERFIAWLEAHRDAGSTFLSISHTTASELERWLGQPTEIAVVRLGSIAPDPSDQFEPRGDDTIPRSGLLMVGTVEPRKGHDVLLDALDLLGESAPTIDVVGQPGWGASDLTKRLDDHRAIRWHRQASDADLEALWAITGLLLQPTRGEGFGLPVLEAIARGVPVLASDLAVLREASEGNATFFATGDAAGLAAHLARFRADPAAWPAPAPIAARPWIGGAADVWSALARPHR